MISIVGIGAGGHAKVMLEILRTDPGCRLIGLLDHNRELWGKEMTGVPVLGGDELLEKLFAEGVRHAFVGVGTVESARPRQRLYELAVNTGFQVVSAVHPQAVVSRSARIGIGVAIMAGAIINAAAQLGQNVIVNTGSVIEHDCIIGDHVHIATGALLAGGVRIGNGSHVGVGASVRQCVKIGCNSIVGAGASVIRDVPDNVIVVGVPARILRENTP